MVHMVLDSAQSFQYDGSCVESPAGLPSVHATQVNPPLMKNVGDSTIMANVKTNKF